MVKVAQDGLEVVMMSHTENVFMYKDLKSLGDVPAENSGSFMCFSRPRSFCQFFLVYNKIIMHSALL